MSEVCDNVTNARIPNHPHHLNNLNNSSALGCEIVIENTDQAKSLITNSPDFEIDDKIASAQRVDLTSTSDVSIVPVENNMIECTKPQSSSTLQQSCIGYYSTNIESLTEDTKLLSLVGVHKLLIIILYIITCPVSTFVIEDPIFDHGG